MGQGFQPVERVRKRPDYQAVQSSGRKVPTQHFLLFFLPHASVRRMGVTVTKKIASAVGRNRVKRLVREAFRRNKERFPQHTDVVVVARHGAHLLAQRQVDEELLSAVMRYEARAGLGACRPTRLSGKLRQSGEQGQPGGKEA